MRNNELLECGKIILFLFLFCSMLDVFKSVDLVSLGLENFLSRTQSKSGQRYLPRVYGGCYGTMQTQDQK